MGRRQLGNVALKNRIYFTDSFPAGMETLLPDPVINHYSNRAKNGAADGFYIIGDCDKAGNVQTCTRSAFATASRI